MKGFRLLTRNQYLILAVVGIVFTSVSSCFAASVSVDSKWAKPVSRGGIGIHAMSDINALGRDTSDVIVCMTHGVNGWNYFSRSGADYSAGLRAGSDMINGSPFGDTLFARVVDGVSDRDTLNIAIEDSLDWKDMMIECLVRIPDQGVSWGYILGKYSAGTGYALGVRSNPTGRVMLFTSSQVWASSNNRYDDGNWHLIRLSVSNSGANVQLLVDSDSPTNSAATVNPSAVRLEIGASGGGSYYYDGDIAYIGFYEGTPSDTERDTLWNLLNNHIDGTDSFASIQIALDWLDADHDDEGVTHRINVAPGFYPEPLKLPLDSLLLIGAGIDKTKIYGSLLPSGTDLIEIDQLNSITISGIRIDAAKRHGLLVTGENAAITLSKCLATNCDSTGIKFENRKAADSSVVEYCTFDGNSTGLLSASADSGKCTVLNCIVIGSSSIGIDNNGDGGLFSHYTLFWDNSTDTSGISAFISPNCGNQLNPYFAGRDNNNYYLLAHSPAGYASSERSYLGALGLLSAPGIQWSNSEWGRVPFGKRDPFTR
ncbi:MAG: right-handed parallel beta-helix repeat-containing protein [Candidatus Electryonea clarkiae]|nr:right-handed parallel beta-helix repeat-containing protein [Candidatus Electryonea clarkiae]MDP8289230.1 right-handed parallel beta-helix repeat-containing protein [Candidatus Electryonea clarkiae]